ncbi:GNAT family N-acetyltransferase [Lentibacter algarum]|uniref:GNAT family N-acetyltransferase n=1 Tax=Lentibacter algarum TaxID=576131 RepID=UPI001C0669AB|nr:GNAT family protein [Lentibacter algarum]MBU2981274.1 GNAT family N-acetyltransferase [Lentibacter algarum]
MADIINDLGQPIGWPVTTTLPCKRPQHTTLLGQYCALVPLNVAAHGDDLWKAFSKDKSGANWTYLPIGPFEQKADFITFLQSAEASPDPLYYSVIKEGRAIGHATFLRIDEKQGVIEVGFIHFSPLMQRSPTSTEAMYLMMSYVFDTLGYRRYEWKCDALNAPSIRAAKRLGFSFEGIFRQATTYKGRNRDTAWLSILDSEWPAQKARFERWLKPTNFDTEGRQQTSL